MAATTNPWLLGVKGLHQDLTEFQDQGLSPSTASVCCPPSRGPTAPGCCGCICDWEMPYYGSEHTAWRTSRVTLFFNLEKWQSSTEPDSDSKSAFDSSPHYAFLEGSATPHSIQHLTILLAPSSPFFFSIFLSSFQFFHPSSSQEQELKFFLFRQWGPAENFAFRVSLSTPAAYQEISQSVPSPCGVLVWAVRIVNVSSRYISLYIYITCSYKIMYLDVFIYSQTKPKQFLWGQWFTR